MTSYLSHPVGTITSALEWRMGKVSGETLTNITRYCKETEEECLELRS